MTAAIQASDEGCSNCNAHMEHKALPGGEELTYGGVCEHGERPFDVPHVHVDVDSDDSIVADNLHASSQLLHLPL